MTPPATRAPAKPDADQLAAFEQAFDAFFAAVRRARGRAAREGSGEGLTLAQYQLLAAFYEVEECPVGELAESGGIAPPTATRMLDGLERDGIVERRHSTEDRRRVSVRLTGEGRRLLNEKRKQTAAAKRRMFNSLTPTERADAAKMLGRLAELFEQL